MAGRKQATVNPAEHAAAGRIAEIAFERKVLLKRVKPATPYDSLRLHLNVENGEEAKAKTLRAILAGVVLLQHDKHLSVRTESLKENPNCFRVVLEGKTEKGESILDRANSIFEKLVKKREMRRRRIEHLRGPEDVG